MSSASAVGNDDDVILEIFNFAESDVRSTSFEEAYQHESSKWPHDLSRTPDPHKLEHFIASAHALVRRFLPPDVIQRLESFIYDPLQPPALVIRGLPIDPDLPPTSPSGLQTKLDSGNYRSEVWLLGIARVVGQPFTLDCLARGKLGLGRLIKDLYPAPAQRAAAAAAAGDERTTNTNTGPGVHHLNKVDFQVDFYQLDRRCFPDAHVFIGLRGGDPANRGRTLVCDFRELYRTLDPADRALLRWHRLTWEVGAAPKEPLIFSKYVIEGGEEDAPPVFNILDESAVRAAAVEVAVRGSGAAVAAYRRVKEAAARVGTARAGVCLGAGDVLLINQRRAAYARAAGGGTDRWWQERVYVNGGAIWKPWGLVPWPGRCLPAETTGCGGGCSS